MRAAISALLLGLVGALAVLAAEPGHSAYRPHDLIAPAHLHAMLERLDRLSAD